MRQDQTSGFTIMEIMIAIAILAILVAIAVPSYFSYIEKARRTDAMHTLLSIQLAQEKYHITNGTYGTLAQVWGGVTASQEGYYTLSISSLSGSSYTLTATAGSLQSGDSEGATACSPMVLTYANGTTTKTPTACWLND